MAMTTPLKRVRRLGSAKEGADHFWKQRVTAIANVFLAVFLVWLVATVSGATYAEARALIANPIVAVLLLLLVVSGTIHMRLGMQVIIEDYVSSDGLKIALLMLNTFFSILIALACVYSVLKVGFSP